MKIPPNYSLRRRLKELLPYVKGKTVLDVGCIGEGDNPNSPDWLHGKIEAAASYCLGVDIQNDKVAELKAKGNNIIYGDAQDFRIGSSPFFDTVFAGELIEHLLKPGDFLSCVNMCLKPGGKLIITTPNPFSVTTWLSLFSGKPPANRDHKCWFDITTLSNLLNCYGFKITSYKLLPVNTLRSLSSDFQRCKTKLGKLGIIAGLLIELLLPSCIGKQCIFAVCER